jgi:DNA-binding transcriptional MerR regulator
MEDLPDKRYKISEVGELLDIPLHVLRQWEQRFPQLKPRRTRTGRRYYLKPDIEVARRIRQLVWIEKMTTEGARIRLAQEIRGEGRPKTRQEALDLLHEIEYEVQGMLDILGND